MQTIYLNLNQAKKVVKSNKTFFCYNLNDDNTVSDFRLTDDLKRYHNKTYNHFKLVEILTRKSNKLTF